MFRFYTKNMLPSLTPVARPFAWVMAAIALSARASVFILNNKIDVLKRRIAKS
jgi:hypothetical protein